MVVTVMSRGKPMVYSDFHSANEKASPNDVIYESDKVFIVPDYVKMEEIEGAINKLPKFSNLRKELTLKLKQMRNQTLNYEERVKNDKSRYE